MTSSNIPDFLSYSATRHASDIFIIAGRPLSVKIDGKLSTYGEKLMPADTDALIRQIYQLANNRNIDPFLNTGDDDFSFSVPGLSRFRVNAYRQRGSLAAVIRVIAFELPNPDILHIPEDVMRIIPSLLEKITSIPDFKAYGESFDLSDLNTRCVDGTKVTDHHALIITGIIPNELSEAESAVYTLIAGRMLESFSPPCEKEQLTMECTCEGMVFRSRSSSVIRPGWCGVFSRREERDGDEPEGKVGTAVFAEGETLPVMGRGLVQKKTLPKPLYTEATLLGAMETCGKDITDEEAKEAVKDAGIGTPATRAAIIATLFKRDYIERSGKSIRPTEKGLYLFEAVKDMQVADVEMTGCWEKALAQIEGHTLDTETFMRSIRDYTHKAIGEILRLEFPLPKSRSFTCPKCKCGHVIIRGKAAKCDKEGCGLMVFRRFLNKELTDQHLEQLFSSGSTRLIKGFKGKKGISFDAMVAFDESFNLKLVFPKPKGGKGK